VDAIIKDWDENAKKEKEAAEALEKEGKELAERLKAAAAAGEHKKHEEKR
jgi:hypothetical protein